MTMTRIACFSIAAAIAGFSATPASSMPLDRLSGLTSDTALIAYRTVCNREGRCWRESSAPRRSYGGPGYYDQGYARAPGYGYGYNDGYYNRGPGIVVGVPGLGGIGIGGF